MQSETAAEGINTVTGTHAPSPLSATSKQLATLPSLKGSSTEEWIARSLVDMRNLARNPALLSRRKLRSF